MVDVGICHDARPEDIGTTTEFEEVVKAVAEMTDERHRLDYATSDPYEQFGSEEHRRRELAETEDGLRRAILAYADRHAGEPREEAAPLTRERVEAMSAREVNEDWGRVSAFLSGDTDEGG